MNRLAVAIAFCVAVSAVSAADPPTLVNYQGVLRDAQDKPRAGTFDMVFRFYDALSAGNEILVDSHTGGGANAVTVTGGLFNVELGGGTLTDGSGAGTYTSLDQVFRDYGAVYLQITVGAEVLSPRIRIRSAAYALNASNLGGKPASGFVDTTSSSQTKAGHLVVSDGLEGNSASAVGVQGIGVQSGGTFANDQITAVANLGYNFNANAEHYGVHGVGSTAGGWFHDWGSTGIAYVGNPGFGIEASGTNAGGYFSDSSGDTASLASGGYGLSSVGGTGGYFASSGGSGFVLVAGPNTGVDAVGDPAGSFHRPYGGTGACYLGYGLSGISATGAPAGKFAAVYGVGSIDLASGDFGALGHGRYPGAGAFFDDPYASGKSWIGFGDQGIYSIGASAGGYFTRSYHNVQALLGSSDYSNHPVAVYGYSNESGAYPAFFRDEVSGAYAWVGSNGAKIVGNGNVGFIQNHPADPSKTIVYAAPEGDETAVYTRGSARLVDGEARVALGETFALVANPDIGLTATVTSNGEAIALGVVEKSTHELLVRGPAGSNAAFDYMVWGLRVGFEDRAVVQTKHDEAYIPSHSVEQDEYSKAPELRRYSALSRYTRMRYALTGREESPDLTASKALENAIHVFDPATDAHGPHKNGPEPVPAAPPSPSEPRTSIAGPSRQNDRASARSLTADGPKHEPLDASPPGSQPQATLPNTTLVAVTERVEAGDVLANDAAHPGELRRAALAADPGVIGIVGGAVGAEWVSQAPVALPGTIVNCKVDASYAAIAANDLLVASPTPGHAMRGGDGPTQGAVVGKALEPLSAGTGLIRVLVMSR